MKYTAGPLYELINPAGDLIKECSKVQSGFCRKTGGMIGSHFIGRTVHMCL